MKETFLKRVTSLLVVLALILSVVIVTPMKAKADEVTPDTSWYSDTNATSYTISKVGQLAGLAQLVNGGNNFSGKTITLQGNIDMEGFTTSIGVRGNSDTNSDPFSGTFEGSNYSLSHLSVPLFGYVENATISNVIIASGSVGNSSTDKVGALIAYSHDSLTVSNCSNLGCAVKGDEDVGGLIGYIYNSKPSGMTSITGCSSSGTSVSGKKWVGGIVGAANLQNINITINISNCTNSSSVEATSSHAAGIVAYIGCNGILTISGTLTNVFNNGSITSEGAYCGGLIAQNYIALTINNSTNSGNIDGKNCTGGLVGMHQTRNLTITVSNNFGNVTGSKYVGGLVGAFNDGLYSCNINNSYSIGNISGTSCVAGICGVVYGSSGSFDTCFVVGTLTGSQNLNTIFGYGTGSTTTNCYYDYECLTDAQRASTLQGTGLTVYQMTGLDTIMDLDSTVWTKVENDDTCLNYPVLNANADNYSIINLPTITATTTEFDVECGTVVSIVPSITYATGCIWETSTDGLNWTTTTCDDTSYAVSIDYSNSLTRIYIRCTATGKSGFNQTIKSSNSVVYTITPIITPNITMPTDTNISVFRNDATSFGITTTNYGTNTYQWQFNGTSGWQDITGATASTYSIASAVDADAGSYRCVVTSETRNVVNSGEFQLSVNELIPTITNSNSTDITVEQGDSQTLQVNAENTTSYQWEMSTDGGATWSNVTGANDSSLALSNIQYSATPVQYRCVATSRTDNTATSDPYIITVTVTPSFTTPTADGVVDVTEYNNVDLSVSANNADTYQWQVSSDEGATWSDISGANTYEYSLSNVQLAQNGEAYRCVITSISGAQAISPVQTLRVARFIINPQVNNPADTNVSIPEGTTTSFNISATDANSYQWQVNRANAGWTDITNANSDTYTTDVLSVSDSGIQYRCLVCSSTGDSAISGVYTVTVNAVAVTVTPTPVATAVTPSAQTTEAPSASTVTVPNADVTTAPASNTSATGETTSMATQIAGIMLIATAAVCLSVVVSKKLQQE